MARPQPAPGVCRFLNMAAFFRAVGNYIALLCIGYIAAVAPMVIASQFGYVEGFTISALYFAAIYIVLASAMPLGVHLLLATGVAIGTRRPGGIFQFCATLLASLIVPSLVCWLLFATGKSSQMPS